MKITLTEKNSALNVGISGYPSFTATPVTGEANTFEAPAAGLKFKFNEAKTGFDMVITGNGQVIPFTKEK